MKKATESSGTLPCVITHTEGQGCVIVLDCKRMIQFGIINFGKRNSYLVHSRALQGFPGGAVVKNPPANAGDTGLIPGPGRSHMPRSN